MCSCVLVFYVWCERERERERAREGTYTVVSAEGNSTLKKIIAIFSGGKNYYMYGRSFRVTKQTFIPTYMHQKILSCNKLDSIRENASKNAAFRGRTLFGCLI